MIHRLQGSRWGEQLAVSVLWLGDGDRLRGAIVPDPVVDRDPEEGRHPPLVVAALEAAQGYRRGCPSLSVMAGLDRDVGGNRNVSATALRFFFKITLKRHDL